MFLTRTRTAPNGAIVTHHEVSRALQEFSSDYLQLTIRSWTTEAARLEGYPEVWRWNVEVEIDSLSFGSGYRLAILNALLAQADWAGGVAYTNVEPTLDGAKAQKKAQLRGEVEAREFGTFTWDGSTFSMAPADQRRLTAFALSALRASLISASYSVTLDTVPSGTRTLTALQPVAAHTAMETRIKVLWAYYRTLAAQVDAATNLAEVSNVFWDDGGLPTE